VQWGEWSPGVGEGILPSRMHCGARRDRGSPGGTVLLTDSLPLPFLLLHLLPPSLLFLLLPRLHFLLLERHHHMWRSRRRRHRQSQ